MLTETHRRIDSDILDLTGGLFGLAHVTAPVEPEPEIVVPNRRAAMAQAYRARRASWIVATVAAVVLAGGFAAAHQATASTPVHVAAATASPAQAFARATIAPQGGAVVAILSPADTAAVPESTSAPVPAPEAPRALEAPPAPRREAAVPVAMTAFVLPATPPTPSPLQALASTSVDFDRGTAAISIAGAARSAGACLAPEDTGRTARVRVTFSTSGRATGASVEGGAFVGTATGACIARALRGAHVHAFEGDEVAVTTTVHL